MEPIDARAPDDRYGRRPLSWIEAIYVHHDAGPFTSPWPVRERARIAQVRRDHRGQGWEDLAYHLYVFPSGRVYLCGDLDTIRYATAGPDDPITPQVISRHNERGVAMVLAGDFTHASPGETQLAGARAAIAWVQQQVGRALPVRGHREVYATDCPGDTWDQWREHLQEEPMTAAERAGIEAGLHLVWDRAERIRAAALGQTTESIPDLVNELEQLGVVPVKVAAELQ